METEHQSSPTAEAAALVDDGAMLIAPLGLSPEPSRSLPPGVSPTQLYAHTPTPSMSRSQFEPAEFSLPPPTTIEGMQTLSIAETSMPTSPRGRPPIFYPELTQQFPPGEEPYPQPLPSPIELSAQSDPSRDVDSFDTVTPSPPARSATHPLQQQPTALNSPPSTFPLPPSGPPWRPPFDRSYSRQLRDVQFGTNSLLPDAYQFKHLGDRLAGVIMGCTDETKQECLGDEVFGLPAKHWDYLQSVQEGVTFYLFNYSRRSLHGIFKSVQPATWQLKPSGWCQSQHQITRFPAQIRVRRVDIYPCLTEDEYRPVLEWKDNYIANTDKFSFELDVEQVESLNMLFETTKRNDPVRTEPPLVSRGHHDSGGYGSAGMHPRLFGRAGFRFEGRGRRSPHTGRGAGSFRGRGNRPGRGAPRGRSLMGSAHPLARGLRPGPPPSAPVDHTRLASAPPPWPPTIPPPGMGSADLLSPGAVPPVQSPTDPSPHITIPPGI